MTDSKRFGEIDSSWNPITGCLHMCSYCWARNYANRLASMGVEPYRTHGFNPALAEWRLRQKLPNGKFIFVCVTEDTLVNAVDGLLEIKYVDAGDVVLGLCGGLIVPSAIIAKIAVKTETVYRVVTESTEIICSPTHRVLTHRGYLMAKDLKTGDHVCVYTDEQNIRGAKFRLRAGSSKSSRVPVKQSCKHCGNPPVRQDTNLSWERVREVDAENSGEILYDLATTTRNYISNKIVSHNCDMGDMWGDWVPGEWIERVLRVVKSKPQSKFFFLTKNPKRYLEFEDRFSENAVLGVTLETNRDYRLSRAPTPRERYEAMVKLDWRWKAVVIEPILDFDEEFIDYIYDISPEIVYVGYDNYGNRLPEPKLEKTMILLEALRDITDLRPKTIRKAWNKT
ncbi:MAG: DUF5131 family protein [Candidatus Bathyarchaeota archaeon]|nr:DUF5131 family protein [Candidatus Bathyarchaeota archaeon]